MITIPCRVEIFDTNPRRAKVTAIEAPGTDPSAEGAFVLTAAQTEAYLPEANTGDAAEVQISGDTIV